MHCPAAPLQVVAGGAALSYDIGQLCHVSADAAQGAPRYTMSWVKPAAGVSAGILGGTSLQLSAAATAEPGATGTLMITPAGAGAGNTGAGGALSVQVVKAPLPTGRPASVSAKAGQSVTIDLSQYVTSPLPQPVISVLGATTQAGSTATATVTHSGSKVIVTPSAGASGTLTLAASVSDEPGRADRAISVAVTVTVIGHPGAPGTPTATTSSRTLVVSFGAAAANGAPVEYYSVYANGTAHQCPASPCTITGLANGTTYTVYATATNSAGTGPASAQVTAEPNAVPDQVTGLVATPGDGTVALTWQAPVNDGSPITGYSVEVSPPPAGQPQITPAGVTTSHTFTGLTNGTTYTFTLMATNAAGNSPWSLGVTAVPFGKPLTMAAPTAASAAVPDPSATLGITVSWAPVDGTAANGSPVTQYAVSEYQASSSGGPFGGTATATETVAAGVTSTSFTVNNDGSWYAFSVTATNAAGESAQSPASSPAIQAAAPPNAPAGITAKATGQSQTIQFSFTAGAANARQVSSIEWGLDGASEAGTIAGPFTAGTSYTETLTAGSSPDLDDGSPVTVYVAECNDANLCSSFSGPSQQVTPYAPISDPTVAATANGTTISYSWSALSDGLPETLQVCIAGACNNSAIPATGGRFAGSSSATYGNSQTETITAHLTDTAGQSSGTPSASATTAAVPPPPPANPVVTVSRGNAESVSGCTGGTCSAVHISISGFPASATVSYACVDNAEGQFFASTKSWSGAVQSTNGSGAASFDTQCVWGFWTNAGHSVSVNVTVGGTSGSGSAAG
jgi:hypothetical protein